MSVTSYNSSANCTDNSGIGTVTWTNDGGGALSTTRVQSDDGNYAEVIRSNSAVTHYLFCTDFGFTSSDVPSGATIDGFEIEIRELEVAVPTPAIASTLVKMIKGGSVSGNDIGNATSWPSSETPVVYGSSTELAGLSWSDTDVTASNFGVAISLTFGTSRIAGFDGPWIDQVRIRIYYTAGGGGGSGLAQSTQFISFYDTETTNAYYRS